MSGIINKVKDAISGDKHHDTTTSSTDTPTHAFPTHGTHSTHNDTTVGTHGVHGTHGTHGVHETHDTHGTHTTGPTGTSTNYGPHDSNLANKADPRVDSDLDRRGAGGYGTTTTTTGTHGSTNQGPHSSNFANKLDPRVDSDMDNRGTTGGGYGTTTTGTHGTYGSTNQGPHSSNLMNKADPRVDSDMDNRGTTGGGYGTTGYGDHSGISRSTNAGPHDSSMMNKADPRVDSDLDGRGAHGHHNTQHGLAGSGTHATPGSGRAQNTAGPHNSDMMNKLDPRVDSDLDGSKTMGGNKTHSRSGSGDSAKVKDPTDAASVPPSVLAQHIGEPTISHDGHPTDHSRRHASKIGDNLRDYGGGHE